MTAATVTRRLCGTSTRTSAGLFALMAARRACFTIVCSDHGTAYGEDGHAGHRIGHEVVWTVPYAEFVLPKGYEG